MREREVLLVMIITRNTEFMIDADINLIAVFMEKMEILLILMTCICVILAFLVIAKLSPSSSFS